MVQNEISSYYIKIADDYRNRYIETEKELIKLRESSKVGLERAINETEEMYNKLLEDERRMYEDRLNEKDLEIERLQKQFAQMESQKVQE